MHNLEVWKEIQNGWDTPSPPGLEKKCEKSKQTTASWEVKKGGGVSIEMKCVESVVYAGDDVENLLKVKIVVYNKDYSVLSCSCLAWIWPVLCIQEKISMKCRNKLEITSRKMYPMWWDSLIKDGVEYIYQHRNVGRLALGLERHGRKCV